MSFESKTVWNISTLRGTPDPDTLQKISAVARASHDHDKNPPFSEQTLVALKATQSPTESLTVLLATVPTGSSVGAAEGEVVGVAVVVDDANGNALLELAVTPAQRTKGIATALLDELGDRLASVKAWSHGHQAGAERLAQQYNFAVVRELRQLRRSNNATHKGTFDLPDGVTLRTFEAHQDEQAWLSANAAAFAHHPEQGAMTLADLQARMAEDWFDPHGFFLAVDISDEILGFHWTKVHAATAEQPALGEVYVVGVTPAAQGKGLGKILTMVGLEYLEEAGPTSTMLYVDADNTAAVKLYERLGFDRWETDLMYAGSSERT